MLVGAISRNEGAHSYEFSQTSELLECLMVCAQEAAPQSSPPRQSFLSQTSSFPRYRKPPPSVLGKGKHRKYSIYPELVGSCWDPEQTWYAHITGSIIETQKGQHTPFCIISWLGSQTNHFGFWVPT